MAVHYFAAHIVSTRGNHEQRRRQHTFLEALATRPDVRFHYGHYLANGVEYRDRQHDAPTSALTTPQRAQRIVGGRLRQLVAWLPAVILPAATAEQLRALLAADVIVGASALTWGLFFLANVFSAVVVHRTGKSK